MTSVTNIVFHPPFEARVTGDVLSFGISEPWYRSLPISCIVDLELRIDGQAVPADAITIAIDGIDRTIAECRDAVESYWFVQDLAQIHVRGIRVGATADVMAHLVTRIPYIMVGPNMALPHHTVQAERFQVVSA